MKKQYNDKEELLARYSKALGHPARVMIVKFLAAQSECYFGDLHEILPLTKATVSQHLSELKDAGLIQGTFEPPKMRYCINQTNWKFAKELFEELFQSYNPKQTTNCCEK